MEETLVKDRGANKSVGRRRTVRSSLPRRDAARRDALRVLMITSEWPEPGSSRPTNFIRRQAEFLTAAGVSLDVFAFRGDKNPLNYLAAWARVRPRLVNGGYDVVHAQFGQSGLLALPLPKRLPLVVTFRGCDLLGIIGDRHGRPTLKGRMLQSASRFVGQQADAVIVVAEHMREQLKTRAPIHVIPSGVDLELFRPYPPAEARQQLGLDPSARLVLFVGWPAEIRKRHALAQQAVAVLNERLPAKLVVAWGVSHYKIPLYMSAADVLVVTSMQEGSPNVVKEALACNLPVVSVAVGDVPERLKDVAGTEVCADDQPETIAAALERVLRRGGRIEGRAAVRHLDENLLTRKVVDIYRSVLKGRARS